VVDEDGLEMLVVVLAADDEVVLELVGPGVLDDE
jgi:hypothetical protein